MQPVQVLVLGDSIIQRLENWRQTSRNQEYIVDVMCYRGCTISRLASKIERNRVNISGYDKILIHIGTNDIMCNSWRGVRLDFINLVGIIQVNNPSATIIFSLPLPRPRDLARSWPRQDMLNKWIMKHQQRGDYMTWRTYKTFLQKRYHLMETPKIKSHLDFRRDGLHLSEAGSKIMA